MKTTPSVRRAAAAFAATAALACALALSACAPEAGTASGTPGGSDECAWTTGYEIDGEGLVQIEDGSLVDVHDFCLTCHGDGDNTTGMEWDIIAKATSDWKGEAGVNPHESHLGATQCNLCHADNHTLEMYCNNCHNLEL